MNVARFGRRKIILGLVYVLLGAGIIWESAGIVGHLRSSRPFRYERYYTVNISGNVKKPGLYRVPEGTTHFDILKVAGVRTTSDISAFNLSQQVEKNQDLNVGTRDGPVSLKISKHNVRLEFFFGQLNIISEDGRSRPQQEGLNIERGDRVQTEAKSQVELSIGAYSRLDIDGFSEVVFDRIGATEEDRTVTEIFQRSGICWYKMVYATKNERFKIITPGVNISVAGSGADFLVRVEPEVIRVHIMDGLLLVERPSGEEAVNIIAGQSIAVYSDGRPFQVTRIAADISPNEQFSRLMKEKTDYMMRYMPLNFLFCGPANSYYLFSVQFDKGTIHTVQLPAKTSVRQFAQGFSSLNEAFLYGGVVFVTTLVEQIMNIRISNYCVFSRDGVIRTAASIGGIALQVDEKAASHLGIQKGLQKLSGQRLMKFMAPAISGQKDSRGRQIQALKSLFENLRSRNIVITALLADQIIANIKTDFTSADIMNHYLKFTSRSSWAFKSHMLPTRTAKVRGKTVSDPDLEKARQILFQQG